MTIIGITLTHDGTISVIKNGEHIFSLAEERINRIKFSLGFPFGGLRYIIENDIIKPHEVSAVAIASDIFIKDWARTFAFLLTEDKKYYDIQNDKPPQDFYINDSEWEKISSDEECRRYVEKKIRNILDAEGVSAPIFYFDHHLCHAAGAYVSGGRSEALAITLDGEGDLKSGTVNICRNGTIKTIGSVPDKWSIGWLYSEVTRRCGFKTNRHEGKITGLAAYGDPRSGWKLLRNEVILRNGLIYFPRSSWLRMSWEHIKTKLWITPYAVTHWRSIINDLSHLENKDLAAATQYTLEKRVSEFVDYWTKKTDISHVVASGGVFANVKLNQSIAELDSVDSFFVFPNMGDGGNAYGAAILAHKKLTNEALKPKKINNMYLGPKYSNSEIESLLKKHPEFSYRKSEDVVKETALLIADKKIIGWFQGSMEYGPRALGNRSILAHPTDPTINAWLNKRMKRTEFMPFAPSCLYEEADDIFDIGKSMMKFPAEFMTITFQMKDAWIKKAPAVAHVDGTARPQLVRKDVNRRYHELISEYKRITGLPILINTSFNVHEEPIVMSPEDALASLKTGVIDVLIMEDYVVTQM